MAAACLVVAIAPALPAEPSSLPGPNRPPPSIPGPDPAGSADFAPGRERVLSLLDVPFVPQSEALCGGAAAAMVLRFWGETHLYAEDFSTLVREDEGGIRTQDLEQEIQRRGYRTVTPGTTLEAVQDQLSKGRPVLALIEDRPGRFHYVVVVAWAGDHILLHDPARAPYRVLEGAGFLKAWAKADFWALVVLPPEPQTEQARGAETGSHVAGSDGLPAAESQGLGSDKAMESGPRSATDRDCAFLVDQGVKLARAGDLSGAESLLSAASEVYPDSAGPWRELAGVHFRQERYTEAIHYAERALRADPEDAHALRILATSRFLRGETEAALEAWNRLGEPRIDLVRIDGLVRTRYHVVADLIDLPPGRVLTAAGLRRAKRRMAALPTEAGSWVHYQPLPDGATQVEIALLERPLLFEGPRDFIGTAVRAALSRELRLELSGLAGSGETWTASWRWWERRPRVSLTLRAPGFLELPGIWRVAGSWERQSYAVPNQGTPSDESSEPILEEERRRVSLGIASWATADLLWEAEAAVDHWTSGGDSLVEFQGAVHRGEGADLAASLALERRLAGDRVAFRAESAGWSGLTRSARHATGGLHVSARSSAQPRRLVAQVRAGFLSASRESPLALWPGAGTGYGRAPLLRAHPLLESGILRGKVFGRNLVHGGVELEARPSLASPLETAFVAFLDAAEFWNPISPNVETDAQFDVGLGLRLGLPGRAGGFRLDFARGLRDHVSAASAAWRSSWPTMD